MDETEVKRALRIVQEQIEKADFDRDRFRVRAVQSADGTKVEVYADTIQHAEDGNQHTNYNPIPVDAIIEGPEEQIRDVISDMVSGLAEHIAIQR